MKRLTPSPVIALAVIGTQLLGPAVLWAADQRGVRIDATRRVVVSALSGDQLTLQNGGGTKTLQFREGVAAGDRLTTGDRTMAEVLLGTRAVVTVGQGTSVQFTTVTPEQTTIQVSKGTVRVAAAASVLGEQGLVTVQTPTGQVQTRGGIVRVLVDAPVRAADQTPTGEARPYLASYSPTTLLAAVNTRGDVIQVEEGTAEILGAGPGAKVVTVQAGQAVGVQAGQAGPIAGITTQDTLKPGVVATAGHRSTPKEGMDNLVALQVDQATQLGKALTGAAETGEGQSGSKDESGKALNGATGGVALANAVANALFGSGSTANATSGGTTNTTGTGYGANNNSGTFSTNISGVTVKTNGSQDSLLVFTRKDPVQSEVKETIALEDYFTVAGTSYQKSGSGVRTFLKGEICGDHCLSSHTVANQMDNVIYSSLKSVVSEFTVAKELVLIGGANNIAHGGKAPDSTLIVRGVAPGKLSTSFTNQACTTSCGSPADSSGPDGIYGTDRHPAKIELFAPTPNPIREANSTFVVEKESQLGPAPGFSPQAGTGTLGQFSNQQDGTIISGNSFVDGAITATSSNAIPVVNLTGGVTLDQGTKATIGTTEATNTYYTSGNSERQSLIKGLGTTYSGSLLSVINGPNSGVTTSVTVQDRLLGVYDGSTIEPQLNDGNKALLSVLDAKLKGPSNGAPLIDVAAGSHFDRDGNATPGSSPDVKVTSAVVVRSTIPLDGALLEASAPLFVLTNATMTTASHFADLAGKGSPNTQAMLVNGALVALNASQLLIQNGHLLNLNAANATVNGYLFSLTGGSTLTLNNGSLFSLNNGSSLALNANAFGVFGSGANTLSITNSLCAGGAACGLLVNAANTPFLLNGTPIKVAGVSQNVVLPNSFNVFAVAQNAPAPTVTLSANAALFKVDGTSTLTINATKVR